MFEKSLLLTAFAMVSAEAFDSSCALGAGTFDMNIENVVEQVQDCGLIFSPKAVASIALDLVDIGTTGYVWHSHVTPENCLSIASEKLEVENQDQGYYAGRAKQIRFSLNVGEEMTAGSQCTLHLVQARPWQFSGFEKDGSYTKTDDQKSFVVPIHVFNHPADL